MIQLLTPDEVNIIYQHKNNVPLGLQPRRTSCFYIGRGRRGRDRMVGGFTTTYAINAYHH